MYILFFAVFFLTIGFAISSYDKEKKFGLWLIGAISVFWGFVFGPWAIATFIELYVGYSIVDLIRSKKGESVDNSLKSAEWYQDEGYPDTAEGLYRLGEMYENHEIPVDPQYSRNRSARQEYQRAADQGHAGAQYKIGCLGPLHQYHGDAVYYMRKAAEQGHAKAQCRLSEIYFDGIGVPEDHDKSYYWLDKAKDQGEEDAHNLELKYIHIQIMRDNSNGR